MGTGYGYRMGPRIVGAEVGGAEMGGAEVGGAEVKLDVTMWNVACDVSGWLFLMQMYWYVYTHGTSLIHADTYYKL